MRPLKSINSIKGIKVLMRSLFTALPALSNVIIFLSFILVLYGTLGIQLFDGVLENRCRQTPEPVDGVWLVYDNNTKLCGYSTCDMYFESISMYG